MNNSISTGHQTVFKTLTIKQAVKSPKINDMKPFVKDENRPNIQKRKTNNNDHNKTILRYFSFDVKDW